MPKVIDHKGRVETDPLRNFKFVVVIDHPRRGSGLVKMGFMAASGLNVATEVIPYREGGMNTSTRKMPGQTNYSDITLTTGVIIGRGALWNWYKEIFFVQQGAGFARDAQEYRCDMAIHVMGHPINNTDDQDSKALFDVYNAWPSSIAFSDLDAGGNAVLVSQVVIAHEGWKFHLARDPKDNVGGFAGKRGRTDVYSG